jgi:hypothetical protein
MKGKESDSRRNDKGTTPKDAQKGGQGGVSKDNPDANLDQRGHPGSRKTN